jgi:hypothetical protein
VKFPDESAVVFAADTPASETAAPLPDAPRLPEMLHVEVVRLRETVLAVLPAVAVMVAVCVLGTLGATVAEKAAVVAPAAIETLAGTVTRTLPLANITLKPPVGAAPLSFTVHVETPAGPRVKGAQVRLVNCVIEIVPAAPVAGIAPPDPSAAIVPVAGIVVEASTAPDATVNVAVANRPSLSTFELMP